MAITTQQLENLQNNTVDYALLAENGLDDSYYLSPLAFMKDVLNISPKCSGAEWKHACEMAHDEDLTPEDATLPVIVDGILAFIYAEELERVGIDLTTYFTYRFHPPSREFQNKLDEFKVLVGA